jgi:hypothetical protein
MAYVDPTAADFEARFPEFAGQDDAIAFALEEAKLGVDASWTDDAQRRIATMLLAAHLLSSGETAASGKEIASESIGPFSVSYFRSEAGWLESTGYGARYMQLVRLNKPRILVI